MSASKLKGLKRATISRVNAVRRHGWFAGMHWRPNTRKQLIKARMGDKSKTWSKSFDAGLAEIKKDYYGIDLLHEIRRNYDLSKRQGNYTVLELGCGTGRLPSELAGGLGEGVRIIASGVRREPQWKS